MASLIDDLKAQARAVHRLAQGGDPTTLARLSAAGEHGGLIQRRHCLTLLARELGFSGWPHALAVLRGEPVRDFGTLLYPDGASAFWNVWSASYEEARAIRGEHGGYLLAYKHQFFIAESHFLEALGVASSDGDWELIGRDWVKPHDGDARARLYAKIVRARQASAVLDPFQSRRA